MRVFWRTCFSTHAHACYLTIIILYTTRFEYIIMCATATTAKWAEIVLLGKPIIVNARGPTAAVKGAHCTTVVGHASRMEIQRDDDDRHRLCRSEKTTSITGPRFGFMDVLTRRSYGNQCKRQRLRARVANCICDCTPSAFYYHIIIIVVTSCNWPRRSSCSKRLLFDVILSVRKSKARFQCVSCRAQLKYVFSLC